MKDPLNINDDPVLTYQERLKASGPFGIPDRYFLDLTDRIMDRIQDETISTNIKKDLFKIPDNYFNQLTERILNRVETKALPESLNQNPFLVPEAYFNKLTDQVTNKLQTVETGKNIRIRFNRSWILSAAACIVIVVSFYLIQLFKDKPNVDFLAQSSEEELLEYVSFYSEDFDHNSLASILNEEEINSFDILDNMDDETSNFIMELYE